MHQEINSPDISKVYACVFWPVKIPMCMLFKQNSLKLMEKFINMRENIHRGALF